MVLHHKTTDLSPILDGKIGCPRQTPTGQMPPWFQVLLDHYHPLTTDEIVEFLELQGKIYAPLLQGRDNYSDADSARFNTLATKVLAYVDTTIRDTPKKHQNYELGAREFTFTYSPKWMTDEEARQEMTKAIDKLCRYYANEIVELRAIGEVGTNGLSHVHCFYKLQGGLKITDKNFKRAWKWWNPKKKLQQGFEGGHHATVKVESDFQGYIDKHVASAWLEKNLKRET